MKEPTIGDSRLSFSNAASDSGGFRQSTFFGSGDTDVTDDMMHIEISVHERDVLLQGLRYVRSSIMLASREPSPDDTYMRSGQLDEIQMLSQRLESTDPMHVAS